MSLREKPCNVEVIVPENGDIEYAIRKFKSKVKKSGILDEYKEASRYEKPSEIRHREKIRQKRLRSQPPKPQ